MNSSRLLRHLILGFSLGCGLLRAADSAATPLRLEDGFAQPPLEARPWTLWQWMNGNISKEGITADLEAFQKAGLGGAQSFHLDYGLPPGPVEFMSPEWFELYLHAAREADRLGIEIGTHNGGGWSTSGGPWTLPENGMQVVTTTEVRHTGPGTFDQILPQPASYLPPGRPNAYRDIAVLAYPTPRNERTTLSAAAPKVTSTGGKGTTAPQLSGDLLTSFVLPAPNAKTVSEVTLAFAEPFTVRQLILTPEKRASAFSGVLEASDDGKTFRPIRTFQVFDQPHRQNYPYRQAFPVPEVSARFFRVSVDKTAAAAKLILIAELGLSGRETIEDLPGKAFYQRHALSTKPLSSTGRTLQDGAVAMTDIVDLTDKLDASGRLRWDAPAGTWTIVRIGHQPNGTLNHPAPAGGEGLDCDKLSREAVDAHWAGMLGRMIEKFGPLAGRSFTKVEIDSWEVGTQNWTPKFRAEFQRRRGYDLLKFLPVFAGQIVDNTESTERFLWDLRRTIADLLADNYAAHLRELANQHGLKLAVENYGTGPFDERADLIVARGETGVAGRASRLRADDGRAGVGQLFQFAEHLRRHRGDVGQQEHAVAHAVGHHEAAVAETEAVQEGVGRAEIEVVARRHGGENTAAVSGRRRIFAGEHQHVGDGQALLQQKLAAPEVAEPRSAGVIPPRDRAAELRADLAEGEAGLEIGEALEHARVEDHFVHAGAEDEIAEALEGGRVAVPAVAAEFAGGEGFGADDAAAVGVRGGGGEERAALRAAIVHPVHAHRDVGHAAVLQVANALWQPTLDAQGHGVSDQTTPTALAALGLAPDFEARGLKPQVAYKHRARPEAEIYFVSNQKYQADEFEACFRVTGKAPELWNAETGEIAPAPLYREENGRTIVPLRLEAAGSVFVVFRTARADHLVSAQLAGQTPSQRQTLEILRAHYGRFDAKAHPRIVDLTNTRLAGVKRIMTPERFAGADPAPGARKHQLAQYTVDDAVLCQAVPADSVLELPQLPTRFKMSRILYGDLNAATAPGDDALDVTAMLRRAVNHGAVSLKVDASLAGGSPLPRGARELRAEYLYNGRWNVAFLPDGAQLDLPGTEEANAGPREFALHTTIQGAVELLAWKPGRYEFATAAGKTLTAEIAQIPAAQQISGPWRVTFPPKLGAPAQTSFERLTSWTESADVGVKYFSGTATYVKTIEIPAAWTGRDIALELDLGEVKNVAQVFLNGQDLGVLWKPPFRVALGRAAHAGSNQLEIKVTNLWINRLIGDEQLPADREWNAKMNLEKWPQWLLDGKPSPTGQITFTTARHWKKDDPLVPSGLLGPVQLIPAVRKTVSPDAH